jgi:hypothetical protein
VWYTKLSCETEAELHVGLDQGCAEGVIFEDNFIKVFVGGQMLFCRCKACLCVPHNQWLFPS